MASLSAQVVGLELVTGEGKELVASSQENPDVLELARLGLGALGVLTSVTLAVEPIFTLAAHEAPMTWDQALAECDELVAANDHFEMYWFPHTDRLLTKRNNRTADEAEPLGRFRGGSTTSSSPTGSSAGATGWATCAPDAPAAQRARRRVPSPSAGSATCRTGSSPRRDGCVFREMEYAVPREAGLRGAARRPRPDRRGATG